MNRLFVFRSSLLSAFVALGLMACSGGSTSNSGLPEETHDPNTPEPDDDASDNIEPSEGGGTDPQKQDAGLKQDAAGRDAGNGSRDSGNGGRDSSSDARFDAQNDARADAPFVEAGRDAGPDGPVGPNGVDRVNCVGVATSTGTVNGVTPNVHIGFVTVDPSSGGFRIPLAPQLSVANGDLTIGVYFTPISGQLSYPPNGTVGCAILQATSNGWSVVDRTTLCEVTLNEMSHASAPGVCDGTIAGAFRGIFTGNAPLGGTFYLPSDIAASQLREPSCRPRDGACSDHNQCCSQSCSRFIGVCN